MCSSSSEQSLLRGDCVGSLTYIFHDQNYICILAKSIRAPTEQRQAQKQIESFILQVPADFGVISPGWLYFSFIWASRGLQKGGF